MSLAALFTAHGWGVLEILIDFFRSRDALALITEWAPTNLGSLTGFIFLVGLAVALIGHDASRRPTLRVLWLVLPFLYLAVSSTRSLPFGWLALLPLLALAATDLSEPTILSNEPRGRWIVNGAIGLTLLTLPFVIARAPVLDPEHFPVEAARHLGSGHVFHDDTTGGYLIYAYGPQRQVYIDDRAELFKERVADFIRLRNADSSWEEEFSDLAIEQALLKKTDPLVDSLTRSGWDEQFADSVFILLRSPN